MTELKFRNIDVTPDDPVSEWGFEGVLACLERGHLKYWRKLAQALQGKDSAPIRSQVALALGCLERPSGISTLFERMIAAGQ